MIAELTGEYTLQEAAAIKGILAKGLVKHDPSAEATAANFLLIGQTIPKEFGKLFPQQIEKFLRDLFSSVFLTVFPNDGKYINNYNVWARLPQEKEELSHYFAPCSYRCRADFDSALKKLFFSTYENNFALLAKAGVPMERGTDWSNVGSNGFDIALAKKI